MMDRRVFLQSSAAACGMHATSVFAQSAPDNVTFNRPIVIVVPFAPGASIDTAARLIAPLLASELGTTVIIENKPGAGGSIGASFVARAPSDGYTLLLGSESTNVVNPAVNPNLPYDAIADFAPIGYVSRMESGLVASKNLPVNSFEELVAYARANPDKISYASAGEGSLSHINMEILKSRAGIPMSHVPYRGGSLAQTDLLGGIVHLFWSSISTSLSSITAGKLKVLAVTSGRRLEMLPKAPTFGDLNLPELNHPSWTGLLAPAKTPPNVVARLSEAIKRSLAQDGQRANWEAKGMSLPEVATPQAFGKNIADRYQFYRKTVAELRLLKRD